MTFGALRASIGIEEMPEEYSDLKNIGLYIFLMGDDFWMNPDGTVNSH